jgi:two-component system chemotaxis response regulator CheY
MRILVVDDDAPNRKLLKDIGSRLGECDAAEGGQAALTEFKKAWEEWRPFNLIFLDVLMPDMDGTQVLLKIREIEKDKKISEQHQARIIMDCVKNGCDEFIVKPIDVQLVFEKIKKLGLMISN